MTDASMPLMADNDFEDLPRTVRREKEARAREARERRQRERDDFMNVSLGDPPPYLARTSPSPRGNDDLAPASQSYVDASFVQLVFFFMKAALAAIPAIVLIFAALYFVGKGVGAFFPDLEKTKIMISFPPG